MALSVLAGVIARGVGRDRAEPIRAIACAFMFILFGFRDVLRRAHSVESPLGARRSRTSGVVRSCALNDLLDDGILAGGMTSSLRVLSDHGEIETRIALATIVSAAVRVGSRSITFLSAWSRSPRRTRIPLLTAASEKMRKPVGTLLQSLVDGVLMTIIEPGSERIILIPSISLA